MGKEAITKELEKRRIPELLRLSDNTPVDTRSCGKPAGRKSGIFCRKNAMDIYRNPAGKQNGRRYRKRKAFGGKP